MFGKNKIQLELEGDSQLAKRIAVIQQKVLTSEKLEQKVFDFIAGFEESVKQIVSKELESFKQANSDIVPQVEDKVAELLSSKLREYVKTEEAEKLRTELISQVQEIKPDFSLVEDKIAELIEEKLNLLSEKTTKLIESEISKRLELETARYKKVASLPDKKRLKEPTNKKELREELNSLEVRLKERLNKVLSEQHKQLVSNSKAIESLNNSLHSTIHSSRRDAGTVELAPTTADLKSYKLSVDKKLKLLSEQLEELNSDITSQDYVALLETEFRNKLNELNERLNSFEVLGFGDASDNRGFASKLVDSIQSHKQELSNLKTNITNSFSSVARLEQIEKLNRAVRGLETQSKALSNKIERLEQISKTPDIEPRLGMLRKEFAELKQAVGHLSGETSKINGLDTALKRTNKRFSEELNKQNSELAALHEAVKLRPIKKEMNELRLAIGELGKQLQGQDLNLSKVRSQLIAHKGSVAKRTNKLHTDFKSFEEYCIDQIERTNKWIKFINKSLE